MYKLLINGKVIPLLSRKKNVGYFSHYRATGSFGKVSIYHYQTAGFTLTFIECTATENSIFEFLHDMVQPKIYAVLSGMLSTLIVEGIGLILEERQYGLLCSSHGNRAISLPAGQSCVYCIVHFPVAFLKDAIPAHDALIPLYLHTIGNRKYLSTPLCMEEGMEKELDAIWRPLNNTVSSPLGLPPDVRPFLHQAFVHYSQAIPGGTRDNRNRTRKIRKAAAIIGKDPASTYTIDSLSLQVGLSPSSLKRGFHRLFQTTIHKYVIEKRLEMAAGLLLRTSRTEQTIAGQCGFSGNDALIRSFKKRFGCTPSQIRTV